MSRSACRTARYTAARDSARRNPAAQRKKAGGQSWPQGAVWKRCRGTSAAWGERWPAGRRRPLGEREVVGKAGPAGNRGYWRCSAVAAGLGRGEWKKAEAVVERENWSEEKNQKEILFLRENRGSQAQFQFGGMENHLAALV